MLELLCDTVAAFVRQGKGLVISGFPRDLRRAEEYEAKVRTSAISLQHEVKGYDEDKPFFI